MKPVAPEPLWFSRADLAEIDRRAVQDYGIPVLTLMENAGRAVAEITQAYIHADSRILVVAGPGNNGGDGLVAARHLRNRGHPVQILLAAGPEKFSGPAGEQLRTIRAMELPVLTDTEAAEALRRWVNESHVDEAIIDALFGTGLSRPVTGLFAAWIETINQSGRRVVSADIPSGLDCDTGQPLGCAIQAAHTVSFCGIKIGFAQPEAARYIGQCSIGDIGAPRRLLEELARPMPG